MFKDKLGKFCSNRCKVFLETASYTVLARKDEDGKVIVGPRNFTTKPIKKGHFGKGVYFDQDPQYVSIGKLFLSSLTFDR